VVFIVSFTPFNREVPDYVRMRKCTKAIVCSMPRMQVQGMNRTSAAAFVRLSWLTV